MFENFYALTLLVLLLPVIISYMLKPRPRIMEIPSLMLLLQSQKKNLKSLLRTLIRDPLLLIQLLVITVVVLSMANPYYLGSVRNERMVIVLDASASMAATDVSPDRFSQAVNIAKEYAQNSDKISVVLAENAPVLLLKDVDERKAMEALQQLEPKATGTDVSDAVLFAAELVGNEEDKIAVISDFSGQDITGARKIIESKGISAEYRQIGTGGSNVGIVEATLDGNNLKFFVKNYNDIAKDIRINVVHGNQVESINKKLKQKSREVFYVSNISAGKTQVVLEPDDNLLLDNILYISVPESMKKRVLLISDSVDKKAPLSIAFNSIPSLEVHEVSFDRAPRTFNYDMVVLHDYTQNSPLPGTMDDLRRYADGGGTLVFVADSELQYLDTKGLLPVNVSEPAKPSRIEIKNSELTKDIDFGISAYLRATLKEDAVELASAEEGTVLAYWSIGKGKVVYLGINDKWGDFHLLPSYPVFWFKLLNFAAPMELNFKTGTFLPLGTDNLFLDETGFYKIEGKTIASNLLDEKESDISVKRFDLEEKEEAYAKNIEKIHIDDIFSIFAILLIALELYYLKYRGEM